ncbi:MAG: hypothetical protein ACM3TT_01300 [Syntrophothermus sp.]
MIKTDGKKQWLKKPGVFLVFPAMAQITVMAGGRRSSLQQRIK